jgi:Zn-dependent protease
MFDKNDSDNIGDIRTVFEPRPETPREPPRKKRGGLWGILAGVGVVLLKFKTILIALKLGKFATTILSMLIMIWVYATQFGWWYAAGFVLLIAVHEGGHFFAARYVGLKVSAPIFIPFVGAFISMKQQPSSARMEAIIAAGGPVIGSIGAFACLAAGIVFQSNLLIALAYSGCLINLFNLVPVSPLDGGRIVGAISPKLWFIGIPVLAVILFKYPNPIIVLMVILGLVQAYRTFRSPDKSYFKVSRNTRISFAVLYFGLMIVLGVTMAWIHGIHSTGQGL